MKTLLDIEVFYSHFEVSVEDYVSKESKCFMVNEFRDDREELKSYLNSYKGFMITFNGIRYDFAVLTYLQMNNWFADLSWEEFCFKTKQFSDQLINTEDDLFVYQYIDREFKDIIHIDLMLYWSKGLRQSKKISLKGLGVQLNYPVIQELPYSPDIPKLNREQIDEIHHYCSVHDLGILRLLTYAFEGKSVPLGNLGTIQLRGKIVSEYGINAWSMDAPKIASEALLKSYCKSTNQREKDVSKLRFDRPTFKFRDLFDHNLFIFETPVFQSVFEEWMESHNEFSKEFIVGDKYPVRISAGVGGIHAINDCEIYESDEDYCIITDDISAMYPTNIENFHAFRFPEILDTYNEFKTLRKTVSKPGLKSTKKGSSEWIGFQQLDLFYKVVLNGVSGLLDMEYSWLFNPIGIMKVRVGGQLILLWIIEQCVIKGIQVISVNTDGLELRIKRSDIEIYSAIIKEAERKFNVEFERDFYKKIVYANVNSYVAITESGQIKQKGSDFITNPELGNSTDMLVYAKCLVEYFVNGISPEDYIKSKDLTIFDFCLSQKVSKQFDVYWNGEKLPQRLNRYYASKRGAYLYKLEKDESWQKRIAEAKTLKDKKRIESNKPNFQHLLKESGVQLYNVHEDKPIEEYNINYNFYLNQINKRIAEIERLNQLTLF